MIPACLCTGSVATHPVVSEVSSLPITRTHSARSTSTSSGASAIRSDGSHRPKRTLSRQIHPRSFGLPSPISSYSARARTAASDSWLCFRSLSACGLHAMKWERMCSGGIPDGVAALARRSAAIPPRANIATTRAPGVTTPTNPACARCSSNPRTCSSALCVPATSPAARCDRLLDAKSRGNVFMF